MEEKDLAKDLKKEELLEKILSLQDEKKEERQNDDITIRYYDECELELGKNHLKVSIAEITEKILQENKEPEEMVTYDVYMKYNGQDVLIGSINQEGYFEANKEILEKIDPENKLGLLELGEQEKPDLSVLKELDGKTAEELQEELGKNEIEGQDEQELGVENEEDGQELEENEEEEKNVIAEKKHIPSKNVFLLRKDSQFFKNYPQIPKSTYFYRDNDGKIKAEFIDKDGKTQPSEFFNDSTTNLTEQVISLGDDADPIEKGRPYQVMTTNGLANRNSNARDVRVAIYIRNGYMEFEEMREGYDGKRTGYALEGKGRDYNSKRINEISDITTGGENIELSEISKRYEEAEKTGLADDGVQLQDLSPRATIERFMEEGYNKEEAIDIFNYMVGPQELSEEVAKERVNEEIVKRIEAGEREQNEDEGRTPWGDVEDRRRR